MGKLIFGVIVGLILAPVALLAWFHWGHPPVAVTDPPLPFERQITHVALDARVAREAPATAPIQPSEDNFVAGAGVYRDQCAACHGFYGKPAGFAAHMYPSAPQLWQPHKNSSVVGVSDDPPGETYWKVANGIRLTGMPSFKSILSDNEMWQVSLLLANADKPLPDAAVQIVKGQQPSTSPAPAAPAAAPNTPPAKP